MFNRKTKTSLDDILEMHSTDGGVALLEPEPTPQIPVMTRASQAIEPFTVEADVKELDFEISRLSQEQKRLYGIEAHASQAIGQKLHTLQNERRVVRAYNKFRGNKRKLSSEVLTWRKSEPLYSSNGIAVPQPELALFGLGQDHITLNSQWSGHGEWNPTLPVGLTELYKDVYERLGSLNSRLGYSITHSLLAAFSGVIPAETKEKIRDATADQVFSDIRLLAETEWSLDVHPNPRYADPIVVGLVNCEMWVIDVFDPTPLEDYIAREFTS
jgi:hypothetical protein